MAPARALPDRMKAILLMCGAVTLFSCLDTTAKFLTSHSNLPTAEVVWMRFLGQFLIMVAILGPTSVPSLLNSKKPGLQMVRSFLMVATTLCNFIAIQYLRLDQTVAVAFLAPLLVALLAGPVLGEYVGWRRGLAVIVGFLGILIAVRPGFNAHPAFIASFLSMIAYALFMIITRKLSTVDSPQVTLFFSLIVGTVGGALVAVPQWVWPTDWSQWVLLASLGVFGGLGHLLLIFAYNLAPASVVSPFLYFQLLSMVSFGFLVFGDVPDTWSLAGSAVVIASGLYLVHRERVVGVKPVPLAE